MFSIFKLTYTADFRWYFGIAVSINPANCKLHICNSPMHSYPLQNQLPNSMFAAVFLHQTCAEILLFDAPSEDQNRLVRIDPNR